MPVPTICSLQLAVHSMQRLLRPCSQDVGNLLLSVLRICSSQGHRFPPAKLHWPGAGFVAADGSDGGSVGWPSGVGTPKLKHFLTARVEF